MGSRINTIMQTCFFAISGVLPRDMAIEEIKKSIKKTYGKRGEAVVQKNFAAVDDTLANLHEVKVPAQVTSTITRRPAVADQRARFRPERAWPDDHLRRRQRCPSAPCPSMAPSPPAPRSGRSATSPWKSRSGNPACASSAASAPLSARMPSSARRCTNPRCWPAPRRPSSRWMPSSRNCPA